MSLMKQRHVRMKTQLKSGNYFNHGLSRLEALISLFVLFAGLLGSVALQKTERTSHWQSHERAEAILQAYDIIDRIHANPIGKMHGDYNNIPLGEIPASPLDCAITACTPDQRTTYDISQWGTTNSALLANGPGGGMSWNIRPRLHLMFLGRIGFQRHRHLDR
ncbi:MAG: hypothetical protein ACM3NI_11995 [Bacteroidota bacterium]